MSVLPVASGGVCPCQLCPLSLHDCWVDMDVPGRDAPGSPFRAWGSGREWVPGCCVRLAGAAGDLDVG